MSTKNSMTIATCVYMAASLLLVGYLLIQNVRMHARIYFAEEQSRVISEMTAKAMSLSADNDEELKQIEAYIITYYPSGTKQEMGSRLDQAVERCRSLALEIVRMRRQSLSVEGARQIH